MSEQIKRITDQDLGDAPDRDENAPRMPFPTSYVLTADQEAELLGHAFARLEDLENQTGRSRMEMNENWMSALSGTAQLDPLNRDYISRTFMGKRRLYDLTYQNDLSHRPFTLGGIFAVSNLVVPMSRRIARQMTAKANSYFFSTEPWFAATPVGEMDRERADKTDRYLRWKMDQSRLKGSLILGVERAFVVGESVLKTTYEQRSLIFKETATVLVDEQGKDILGVDGDYITQTDKWVAEVAEDPTTGEQEIGTLLVLQRDGQTPQPEEMIWQEKLVTRRRKQFAGPEAKAIHFLDFLCPLEAETVQKADCVAHLYDMPVMNFVDQYRKSQISQGAEVDVEALRKAIDLFKTLSSATSMPKSGQDTFGPDMEGSNSQRNNQTAQGPVAQIVEFWIRYDADGDGVLEEIMLVADKQTRTPIFYDYAANITPNGERPFSVIRCDEVPGRWYGRGAMESFETSENAIALFFNRRNAAQSRSGRVDFWNPANTIEGQADPNLKMNYGKSYTLLPGKTAADTLTTIYLEDSNDEKLADMYEFFFQMAVNESGVSNANDAGVAGLDTSKLATGIRNIEQANDIMFSLYLGHLEPGVSDTLNKMVDLTMVNLDDSEIYTYFEEGEGGEGPGAFQRIAPSDISKMCVDVEVLLTKYRGQQVLASQQQAIGMVNQYYAQPYEVQVQTVEMFRECLKNLMVSDADKVIKPIQLMPTQEPGASGSSSSSADSSNTIPMSA